MSKKTIERVKGTICKVGGNGVGKTEKFIHALKPKYLTYEGLIELAREHYNEGGDSIYECWDRQTFDEWVAEYGEFTEHKALDLFKLNKSIDDEMQALAEW